MLTRVKEILVAASVISINNLVNKDMEWTAELNLKMKGLNHNFLDSLL